MTVTSLQVISAGACFDAGREDHGLPVASARLETFKQRLQNLLDSYAIAIVSFNSTFVLIKILEFNKCVLVNFEKIITLFHYFIGVEFHYITLTLYQDTYPARTSTT